MENSLILEKLKRRYNILDELQDDLLNDLIDDASSHFKLITGSTSIDEKYSFIITDVASKMYNRKGSEGMQSESVDGYSTTYIRSLFDDYMELLRRDFELDNNDFRKKGNVVFY